MQELHKLQVACFMFKVDKGLMPIFKCFLYKCWRSFL